MTHVATSAAASRAALAMQQAPLLRIADINKSDTFPAWLLGCARSKDTAPDVVSMLTSYSGQYRLDVNLRDILRKAQRTVAMANASH